MAEEGGEEVKKESLLGGLLTRTSKSPSVNLKAFPKSPTNASPDESQFPATVPLWDAPNSYSECYHCHARKQQHHCRLCGHMYCSKCTNKVDVPPRFELKKKKGASRVCLSCQKLYIERQAVKFVAKMQDKSVAALPLKTDHREVPDWVAANAYSQCRQCEVKEKLHHCRLCGHLFCGRCTDKHHVDAKFEKKGKKNPVRVCYACELDCRSRNKEEFFNNMTNDYGVWKIFIPQWDMPTLYSDCYKCKKRGGKGHNCRLCGHLFCDKCTSKATVPDAFEKKSKVGPARVCNRCRFLLQPRTHVVLVPEERFLQKKDMLSPDDVSNVLALSQTSAHLVQKLHASACAGCGVNFGLFARRQKCFHCEVYWCSRCLKAHHIGLEQQPKIRTTIKSYNAQLFLTGASGSTRSIIRTASTKDLGVANKVHAHALGAAVVEEEEGASEAHLGDAHSDGAHKSHDHHKPHEHQEGDPAQEGEGSANNNGEGKRDSVVEVGVEVTLEVEEGVEDGPTAWFEVAGRLGEGSYGAVYKATDKRDGKEVAIKVLEREEDEDLKREIDFLEACNDEHIVAYKGTYKVDGRTWIVMEYCSGGSLCDLMEISETTLNEEEIAVVMREALVGLQYLHSNKKLHRDVKAGNILITPLGQCKLADFGVSCILESDEAKRKTTIGSPYWMAPEVIRAKPYDGKADIWSLGITALELARGVPPNLDIHPMRVLLKIPTQPSPTLPDPENWSKEFIDFIARCLEKDPLLRPSALELLTTHPFITAAKELSVVAAKVRECLPDIEAFRQREIDEAKAAVGAMELAKKSDQLTLNDEFNGFGTSVFAPGTLIDIDVEGLAMILDSGDGPKGHHGHVASQSADQDYSIDFDSMPEALRPQRGSSASGQGGGERKRGHHLKAPPSMSARESDVEEEESVNSSTNSPSNASRNHRGSIAAASVIISAEDYVPDYL